MNEDSFLTTAELIERDAEYRSPSCASGFPSYDKQKVLMEVGRILHELRDKTPRPFCFHTKGTTTQGYTGSFEVCVECGQTLKRLTF